MACRISRTELRAETGRRLAIARTEAGLSQAEASRQVGCEQSTWAKWEVGDRMADPFVLSDFARRYGLTLDFLFSGDCAGVAPHMRGAIRRALTGVDADRLLPIRQKE